MLAILFPYTAFRSTFAGPRSTLVLSALLLLFLSRFRPTAACSVSLLSPSPLPSSWVHSATLQPSSSSPPKHRGIAYRLEYSGSTSAESTSLWVVSLWWSESISFTFLEAAFLSLIASFFGSALAATWTLLDGRRMICGFEPGLVRLRTFRWDCGSITSPTIRFRIARLFRLRTDQPFLFLIIARFLSSCPSQGSAGKAQLCFFDLLQSQALISKPLFLFVLTLPHHSDPPFRLCWVTTHAHVIRIPIYFQG